jgi:coenzyme F420-reducing hydrogenase delta subunit
MNASGNGNTKILILASRSGGYAGADSVGQNHKPYVANTYVLPVMSGAMFPEEFYLRSFEHGIDAILIMYSGTDCPYRGAPEHTAKIVNKTYSAMKKRGIDTRRLRLAAICTVCHEAFVREIEQMNDLLRDIGPVSQELSQSLKNRTEQASIAGNNHEPR